MTDIFGLDYAWGRPSITAMRGKGVKFVCRYLSHDTSGKNLTRKEAEQLSRANIPIVIVWESTAKRMKAGLNAGKEDAKTAAQMARDCGMPLMAPIYFACDFDATEHDQAAISAYLKGVASVIGVARTGIYAGYHVVARCYSRGLVRWIWQTYAWSGGLIHNSANIHQYSNGHNLDGISVDYNHAKKPEYGQWVIGNPKPKVDEMELNTRVKVDGYWLAKNQLSKDDYPVEHFIVGSLVDTRVFGTAILTELKAQRAISEKLLEMLTKGLPNADEFRAILTEVVGKAIDIDVVVNTEDPSS